MLIKVAKVLVVIDLLYMLVSIPLSAISDIPSEIFGAILIFLIVLTMAFMWALKIKERNS